MYTYRARHWLKFPEKYFHRKLANYLFVYVNVVYICYMKSEVFTFRGSKDLKKALEAEAEKQDRSISYLIERALDEIFVKKGKKK